MKYAGDIEVKSSLVFKQKDNENTTTIKPGEQIDPDIQYTLPLEQGAANSVLTNDGSGTLSWELGGISGYSGISGISGYSGIVGISGYSGIVGVSGYSGIVGTSGYSGVSGLSGYSTSDHAALTNLDYNNANHTGFQRTMIWEPAYGSYLIQNPN